MTQVRLAIAQQWFEDREMIEAFFKGILYRATDRRDFAVEFVSTNDYGSLGVIKVDPVTDFPECQLATDIMTLSMGWRLNADPFHELRKMSADDRADRAKLDKVFNDYFDRISR